MSDIVAAYAGIADNNISKATIKLNFLIKISPLNTFYHMPRNKTIKKSVIIAQKSPTEFV